MSIISLTTGAQNTKDNTTIINVVKDSIIQNDSIVAVKKKKAPIQHIIKHSAEDYILEDVIHKKVQLYNKAEVTYDEYNIVAGKILIDYNTNTVQAKGIPDENGKYSQLPIFKTKDEETSQDSLIFNYKTKKAIIYGLETSQDGINTLGEKTKRVNDSTIFVRNIIFTTSNTKHPDYYLKTSKAKLVPGKKIITGSTNLVIADVPTPLIFPFAYFPLTKGRTSGIIFPTYGESFDQGFFLQNGGYYFAINDYIDLKVTGDIYTNSSWGIDIASNYKVRYKYNGNFSFNYDNLITGFEGSSDHSISKNFNLQWSHSQDSKSSPNSRFSSSVNLGSSQFFRQSVNESSTGLSLQNTLSSSINYYKKFTDTPFNMTIAASHQQNTNTEIVTATLPSLRLNMDRLYPFAPKNGTKKNALQNIGLTYSFEARNQVTTTEDEFLSKAVFDNAQNGARHNIALSTNMKLFKHFSLSPSINYREVWYTEEIDQEYDAVNDEVITDTISGFTTFRDYNFSTSLSTTAYGTVNFKNSRLKAIRHTIRPSISYNYRPDFSFYNREVQSDANGNTTSFSPFQIGIFGSPSSGVSNALNFTLANTLEGKIKDKENPDGEDKKISILNSFNISSGYDFTRDEFKLSDINITAGTTLFKKMNLNFGATFDPYDIVDDGSGNGTFERVNVLSYNNGGPIARLTNARFTAGYSFSSKDFDKKKNGEKDTEQQDSYTAHDQDLFGQNLSNTNDFQNELKDKDRKENKGDNNKTLPQYISAMPWSLRLSYSNNYSVSDSTGEGDTTSNSLTFSGDIELSPGWKVGASSGYDFVDEGFTYTNFRFTRDLSSWSMNFNWVPLATNSSYYFFIGVKASVLSDLKWDKRETNLN